MNGNKQSLISPSNVFLFWICSLPSSLGFSTYLWCSFLLMRKLWPYPECRQVLHLHCEDGQEPATDGGLAGCNGCRGWGGVLSAVSTGITVIPAFLSWVLLWWEGAHHSSQPASEPHLPRAPLTLHFSAGQFSFLMSSHRSIMTKSNSRVSDFFFSPYAGVRMREPKPAGCVAVIWVGKVLKRAEKYNCSSSQ